MNVAARMSPGRQATRHVKEFNSSGTLKACRRAMKAEAAGVCCQRALRYRDKRTADAVGL